MTSHVLLELTGKRNEPCMRRVTDDSVTLKMQKRKIFNRSFLEPIISLAFQTLENGLAKLLWLTVAIFRRLNNSVLGNSLRSKRGRLHRLQHRIPLRRMT